MGSTEQQEGVQQRTVRMGLTENSKNGLNRDQQEWVQQRTARMGSTENSKKENNSTVRGVQELIGSSKAGRIPAQRRHF
jgi:hypothetical protein